MNLEPRQGLWWPMYQVLCSAAPLAHGNETFEMLLQNPGQPKVRDKVCSSSAREE